jgi:imidazolonepropionase-like amidohydrolase
MRRFLSTLLLVAPLWAQQTVIYAGHYVDPATSTVTANATIIVDGPKIYLGAPSTAMAHIINLPDSYVLPGLIDAHTHLCAAISDKWDLGDTWIMTLQRRPGFRAIEGAANARAMLDAGFTAVRDVGNSGDYLDADLEKSIRFGIIPGPKMIFAGRIIAPYGGQFWDTPADRKLLDNPEYAFADSRDEMRRFVRENVYMGARVIKIVVDGQKYIYSEDDIRFIVQEAASAGVKVAAHVQTEKGAHNAVAAGVASIEHAWHITDEDLALAVKNHVSLVSTDFTVHMLQLQGFDESGAKSRHTAYIDRLRRAYKAGVTVVFGTDIMTSAKGQTRGQLAQEYFDNFAEAGIPAADALRTLTTNAASLLGLPNTGGLISVPGDPTKDLGVLKQAKVVAIQ